MNNRDIIERYYLDHRAELLAFVGSRLGGNSEAEDIVQEVFLRLLQWATPIMEPTLHGLTHTMARNMVNDYCRRHAHHHECGLTAASLHASAADDAASVLSIREVTEFLERGMARLPMQCREAYRLHVYGGMAAADIARQTGQNYKSVEYRLGIARKKVRKYLKHIS